MWIAFDRTRLQGRLVRQELRELPNAARDKGAGQTVEALLDAVVAGVVREVRGAVAANADNVLGRAGMIPDELENAAVALCRRELFANLPELGDLYGETRREVTRQALQLLRDVAAGRFLVVPPDEAGPQAEAGAGAAVTVVSWREDVAGGGRLEGL